MMSCRRRCCVIESDTRARHKPRGSEGVFMESACNGKGEEGAECGGAADGSEGSEDCPMMEAMDEEIPSPTPKV